MSEVRDVGPVSQTFMRCLSFPLAQRGGYWSHESHDEKDMEFCSRRQCSMFPERGHEMLFVKKFIGKSLETKKKKKQKQKQEKEKEKEKEKEQEQEQEQEQEKEKENEKEKKKEKKKEEEEKKKKKEKVNKE